MNVIEYCTEEVERQNHDIYYRDGIERVSWMLDAWCYALKTSASRLPTLTDILQIGKLIEKKKNATGIRKVKVWVGDKSLPPPEIVQLMLDELVARLNKNTSAFAFYRELLEIHPFVDGNGRTGKVVLNWINGTLLEPIFPPSTFWGKPIRNP